MKAIIAILALFLAVALADHCANYQTSYECQLGSDDMDCCIWCKTKGQKGGSCVSGYVPNHDGAAGTSPRRRAGKSWPCGATTCTGGFEGRCAQTANCPNQTPDIAGRCYKLFMLLCLLFLLGVSKLTIILT